jgi:outer membrane protein assembly factor BamA
LAQKSKSKDLPPSAYKLASVIVTGSEHYKSEDIMSVTGMQLGQTLYDQDFKDAARVLGDSGAFTDVAYSFDYSPEGAKLEWKVKDAPHFAPVRFENFVWFSDQALLDLIHTSVPLYHGELPARGRLADQVSEALQAMLAQKAIPGSVDYVRAGSEDGPPDAFVFSVSGLRISIRNVEFAGAGPGELPLLKDVGEKLEGSDYLRSALRTQVDKMFRPIYLERGYLKAAFSEPQAKVVDSDGQDIQVDATFAVDPGLQYKLTEIVLAGNKALSAELLRKLIHSPLDQPADAVQMEKDISAIKQLYGAHGFMAERITPEPEMNDAKSTVRYILNVSEGDLYRMGELEIHGLDGQTTSRLQNEWTLHGGDPYDSSYSQRFLTKIYKEIGDWRVDVEEKPDEQEHTVDVTLRFESKR